MNGSSPLSLFYYYDGFFPYLRNVFKVGVDFRGNGIMRNKEFCTSLAKKTFLRALMESDSPENLNNL